MIACEAVSHDAYGTARDLFVAFFGVIADTLRAKRRFDGTCSAPTALHKHRERRWPRATGSATKSIVRH
jgi:hypothetical protein